MPVTLEEVLGETAGCRKCPLCEGRTNLVFGTGNPHARVMFIGEAPGKNEDLQGEPFVGAAGKFLNELLGEAHLMRSDVYIANILKCRPPGNRDPQPEEIEMCTPYLRNQIRAIHPDYLVTLGKFATQFVLKTDRGITGLHGTIQRTGRFLVVPMYHPAAAIYDRTKRDDLVADFRMLGGLIEHMEEEQAGEKPADAASPQPAASEKPADAASPQPAASEKPADAASPQPAASEKPADAASTQPAGDTQPLDFGEAGWN